MKEESELFDIIKEIKFEIYIVIVSGLKFPNYIELLKKQIYLVFHLQLFLHLIKMN